MYSFTHWRPHAARGFRLLIAATTLIVFALGIPAAPALADGNPAPSLEERIRQLENLVREQGKMIEKQNELLEAQGQKADRAAEPAAATPLPAPAAAAEVAAVEDGSQIDVSAGYGGVKIQTRDKRFKFLVGGRIQLDWAVFANEESQMGDGVQIRRARLKGEGTMFSVWDYKLELNFSTDAEAEITDAWIRYSGYKPVQLLIGHQKVPFSQQSASSSNWQVFQERSMSDAFIDPGETGRRRLGMAAVGNLEHWFAHVGVFGEGLDDAGPLDQDFGVAGRFLWQPITEKTRVAALGGAVYYRDFNGGNDLRFRAKPEADIANTRLVDTGDILNENSLLMYNAEATGVYGPWHAQLEYTGANVERGGGNADPEFFGYYIQAGYFLTGESRNYQKKSGKYKRIMPNGIFGEGGIGAWELALRYSYMDLQDGGIQGGKEWDITAALNWWATPSIGFRFNYVYADADPTSAETLSGADEQVHVFEGRGQVVF